MREDNLMKDKKKDSKSIYIYIYINMEIYERNK